METIYTYKLFSFYNIVSQLAFLAFLLSCSFFIIIFVKHKIVVILLTIIMVVITTFHFNSNIYENYYIYNQIKNNKTNKLAGNINAISYDKNQALLLTINNETIKITKTQFNCYRSVSFMVSGHKYGIGDFLDITYVELGDHVCTVNIKFKKKSNKPSKSMPKDGAI